MPFPLLRPSLRTSLSLQAGLVIFLAVFLCAGSLFFFSAEEDREDLDASLLRQAKVISHILAAYPFHAADTLLIKTLLASEPDHRMAEIRQPDGKLARFATHSPTAVLLDSAQTIATPVYLTRLIDHRHYRILHYPTSKYLIALAARPESLRENLQNVLLSYSVLTAVLLLIILTGGRWLAHRALAPIVELAEASAQIHTLDTFTRLPVDQADPEIDRLAQLLNAMLDRLQTSFALVRRFTADAAHEIKTPLAIIQGHLEIALQTPAQKEDAILLTLREVARLHRLIEGLLLLSRSDAGQLTLQLETLDLSALVEELLHDADLLCAPLGLHLEAQIAPGLHVLADHNQLRQVLLNLLDNACKYNRPEGHIRLHLRLENEAARLEISNTGPAIPPANIPLLFERFQRGDHSRTRQTHDGLAGLGLGLSISREIVQAHGGQLDLVKSENDSTLFVLTLCKVLT